LDMSVDFYCDNYKSGEMLNGLPVYSLDYIEANFKQVLYIISAKLSYVNYFLSFLGVNVLWKRMQ